MEKVGFYTKRIANLTLELNKAQKRFQLYSLLRLIFFLTNVFSIYIFWNSIWIIPAFIVFFGAFLVVVSFSVDAKYQRDKFLVLIEINKNEIEVSKGDWSMFDEGNEFKNIHHPYAHDLDIFGNKSLFQMLNRTVSIQGKLNLAHVLLNGTKEKQENEHAISELTQHIEWCQEFMSEGVVLKKEKGHPKSLQKLTKVTYEFPTGFKILRIGLPVVAILGTILFSIGMLNGIVFSTIFTGVLLPVMQIIKQTNRLTAQVTEQSSRVKIILRQLELFQQLDIKDPIFKEKQRSFFESNDAILPAIKELKLIIKRFEFRLNLLVGVMLNFFLSWDFQMLYQFDRWYKKNGAKIEELESKIGDIEVWISGAIFKFNQPASCFATIHSQSSIEIIGLTHPFIDAKKRVKNDVLFREDQNFLIITGPNMAGKSTYLRSLGLALIFADAGFPICAEKCEIPPLNLYSSMRTSDDLTVESSYFHAELTRLRFIVDAIERGETVFVLLDEILKGTNSKDKELGSIKFLEKLTRLKTKGIIATHDLSLCNLALSNPNYVNRYFDSTIENENLHFTYKINEGVCQNMNASFLLRQMKLVD